MGFASRNIDAVVLDFRLRHPAGSLAEMDAALEMLSQVCFHDQFIMI